MPPAPIPPNEAERLESVGRLSELGHAYRATETILSIVREQLGVDRAYINIVNENTQHPFLCEANGPGSSLRSSAFCGYVVAGGTAIIVPDALLDARFIDNPFVISGFIRFYYGMPVYTPEGHIAGALCVHGPESRVPTENEIRLLQGLAGMVTEELRLARRFAEFERQHLLRQEQLGLLITHTPAAMAMLDRDLKYIAASNRWIKDYRLDADNLIGRCHYEVFPDLPEEWKQAHQRCLAGEELSRDQDRFIRADGTEEFLRWQLVPIRDHDRSVTGIIMFSEVITEAVQSRVRIEEANHRLRLALEAARAGLWDWDLSGDRLHRDDRWWAVHGHEPGSLSEDPAETMALVHPDDYPDTLARTERLVTGDQDRLVYETRMRNHAGEWKWFEIHAFVAERDAEGRARRVVGLSLDIEARKQLELSRERQTRDLAAAKDALEEQAAHLLGATRAAREASEAAASANRAKSTFLTNMSHEIRTPMAAILGYTELLEDPAADERVRADAIATIRRNGEHLVTLINDILDLSKVEAGKMRVDRVGSDPRVVVRESAKLVTELAARKGIAVRSEIDPRLPSHILTDPTRLRQILVNLLGNAVKFTDTGSVTIRAWAESPRCCVFEVEDTGIGMDPARASDIFEPFMRADNSSTRRHSGTGLGLTISARLAEMLGGSIEVVRTALGVGTVIRLSIDTGAPSGVDERSERRSRCRPVSQPVRHAPADATARVTPAGAPLAGARVLLAEDGPDNQRLLSYMLSRAGATVRVVADGSLALEAIGADDSPGFDLLLLDMQMPELDGYETAAALRSRGVTIPIIALTAHAMDGDRDRCLQAGCDDYASKPISSSELIRVCARWLDADARPEQHTRPAA